MRKFQFLLLAGLLLAFTSCDKESSDSGKYSNGALILNEGAFNNSNASISFIPYDGNMVENRVFYTANNRDLGDVLQDAEIYRDKIFMVLNNSGKIEVADVDDFIQITTIEGLNKPRYIEAVDGKLYVSQWGGFGESSTVSVIDAATFQIDKSIQTLRQGAEGVLYCDKKVWVANSGGFGMDSTVTVIDPAINKIVKNITVGYNPKELVADKNGNIWVLCSGSAIYDANWQVVGHYPSSLVRINTSTFEVNTYPIAAEKHPAHLDIAPDGTTLYYGGGYGFSGIFKVNTASVQIPAEPFVSGSFYGFNVSPKNGDIYCMEAPSFTEPGNVKVYLSDGSLLKTVEVGIGPNGAVFN